MLKLLSENLPSHTIVSDDDLDDFYLPKGLVSELNSILIEDRIYVSHYTSYNITKEASDSEPTNYALIPNQYFIYSCKLKDFSLLVLEYINIFSAVRNVKVRENGKLVRCNLYKSYRELMTLFQSNSEFKGCFSSVFDMDMFCKFLDKDESKYRLGAKALINEHGKPRGAKDCFSSVVLTQINLPNATTGVIGTLIYALSNNLDLYNRLELVCMNNEINNIMDFKSTHDARLYKPFVILAGISGTGKTKYIRNQAKALSVTKENYCLTPVRPDWHEPSDVFGYISNLSGKPEFISTPVLSFITKAWREIYDAGAHLKILNGRVNVEGDQDLVDKIRPYWLCLDEMNLAPVEQYFSDYLSILETREWNWCNEAFSYTSDALITPSILQSVTEDAVLRDKLGFKSHVYNELWDIFNEYGIALPFNLIVAGTVNMDETTHGFSRKVIDRALSIDFGEFFPNNYQEFFASDTRNKILSFPIWSQAQKIDLATTIDLDGARSVAFLTSINKVLRNTPFELAYRALNELLLAVISAQPQDERSLKAVWDDFLMCKVLPRIEGDSDKLMTVKGTEILTELNDVLAKQLEPIWYANESNELHQRPDLYREKVVVEDMEDINKPMYITCRSKEKLTWMKHKLTNTTFTSFWP
ncbi:McrB family protein [Cobetia amphilecti]|uniref:McrB family protein n=1 Tax=Cobetia amphilecti TaxID=1055104 RepID=UPI0026E17B92|nr:hypothetical protein [Cobetia amphilecti]MDO6815546.1 hypothetical protein [Cobetia amphilecti]